MKIVKVLFTLECDIVKAELEDYEIAYMRESSAMFGSPFYKLLETKSKELTTNLLKENYTLQEGEFFGKSWEEGGKVRLEVCKLL